MSLGFYFLDGDLGVDGLRIDAVPYLFECEGTNCENLPETHAYLKALRQHVDEKYLNRLLLVEANQWPEDAVAYFGSGDESHMAFHFPLLPRMFMSVQMEDRFPIVDILEQTPAIPETVQWALFLRNHDELTLEMVTDEERDYMYRLNGDMPSVLYDAVIDPVCCTALLEAIRSEQSFPGQPGDLLALVTSSLQPVAATTARNAQQWASRSADQQQLAVR